jgi:hypothetical protein
VRRIPEIIKSLTTFVFGHERGRLSTPSAETIDDPEVLRLFRRLEELKSLDHGFDIHGSEQHRYEYRRLSSGDLARLENKLGYELPDQYRRWLANVGSGAGPGYGLTVIDAGKVHSLPDPQCPISPRLFRDVTELTPELVHKLHTAEDGEPYLFCVWSDLGVKYLCGHGCGFDSYLIVAGPMKGHIVFNINAAGWDMPDGANEAFAEDHGATPPAVLPTFFEWLGGWIESSISELPERRQLRAGQRSRRANG